MQVNNTVIRFKFYLLKQIWLWRVVEQKNDRDEPDGWFPAYKVYKHFLFNVKIIAKKGYYLSYRSKKQTIEKFINWYEQNKNIKL